MHRPTTSAKPPTVASSTYGKMSLSGVISALSFCAVEMGMVPSAVETDTAAVSSCVETDVTVVPVFALTVAEITA